MEKRMRYKYIFFDLDGTLTDSKEGIINSAKYALESFGIIENDDSRLMRFLGPPLLVSFSTFYGFDAEKSRAAVAKYRERFSTVGIFENGVFEGIYDLLQTLTDSGHILVVATSKPKVYADRILARYRLRPYFKFVSGAELDGTRDNKNEVIDYAIEKLGCDRSDVLMVGDRKHDVLGAKLCGVASCAVRYGYAAEGELEECKPDYMADNTDELYKLLTNMR